MRYISGMYRRDTSAKIRVAQRDVQIPRRRCVAQVAERCTTRGWNGLAPRTHSGRAIRLPRVPEQRQVIDYALARRATLADVARGRIAAVEVCDAHPDLLRAARFHGEQTDVSCPICRNARLTRVTYAYGDELLHASGRARSSRTLDALAKRCTNVRIYEVEVCRSCSWNHLSASYLIGSQASDAAGSPPGSPTESGVPGGPTDAGPELRRARQRRTAQQ